MSTDKAYFVGRSELLGWINSTLGTNITKIEDTASGAIACQMMDALHPGVVPIKKVDFNAKNEYEYISNYKVLQDVFNKLQVDKPIDMAKLVKGRPLDNTEFMQWLKSYHDAHTAGRGVQEYDGPARRALCKTGDIRGAAAGKGAAAGIIRSAASSGTTAAGSGAAAGGNAGALRSGASTNSIHSAPAPPKRAAAGKLQSGSAGGSSAVVEQLQLEVAEWRACAEAATKEKEFYYSKLRAIELLCNVPVVAELAVTKVVEEILYAATTEEGEAVLEAAQRQFAADEAAAAAAAQAAAAEVPASGAAHSASGAVEDSSDGAAEQSSGDAEPGEQVTSSADNQAVEAA